MSKWQSETAKIESSERVLTHGKIAAGDVSVQFWVRGCFEVNHSPCQYLWNSRYLGRIWALGNLDQVSDPNPGKVPFPKMVANEQDHRPFKLQDMEK
jgi:hypothetical protein